MFLLSTETTILIIVILIIVGAIFSGKGKEETNGDNKVNITSNDSKKFYCYEIKYNFYYRPAGTDYQGRPLCDVEADIEYLCKNGEGKSKTVRGWDKYPQVIDETCHTVGAENYIKNSAKRFAENSSNFN